MSYFQELPNIQFNNRTKKEVSSDEVTIVKNFFRRAKLREDISNVVTAFDYYSITGNERPEQVAEKFYGDPEFDWVVLLTNNITNIYDEWPLDDSSFYNYMIDKYGSEEAFTDVHHYETLSVVDSYDREILPANLIVDEAFYNAPEYQSLDEIPPGITFPNIMIPGTQAVLVPIVGVGNSIVSINVTNSGLGYFEKPNIFLSAPPVTANASATCAISNFSVTSITGITSGGQGYNSIPSVIFSDPPTSTQATASCELGDGILFSKVSTITNLNGGIGYGITAPTIEFQFPPNVFAEGNYINNSSIAAGDGLEGMYVRSDGLKIYTSSLFSATKIREYNLSSAWDISTLSFVSGLDVSADFSYTTGVELSTNGNYLYVSGGQSGSYKIVTYYLSTAWNLSTATKLNELASNSSGGVRLKSDGTSMYILDLTTPDIIKQYSLSTPWIITTRSGSPIGQYDVNTITGDNNLTGFTFFENGSKLFAVGSDIQSIYEFDLSTPWNISTASYKLSYFVGDKISQPVDVYVDSTRKKTLVAGNSPTNLNKIHQYKLTSVAEAQAVLANSSVNSITITNAGFGYTQAPIVTISNPYPQVTATATASISAGIVTSITITNAGFGYTQTPNVYIDIAPVSKSAIFKVTMNSTSGISSVTIIDGGLNYVNSPFIYVGPPSDIVNVEEGDTYSQNSKTWKWTGTEWKEKISDEVQYFDPISSSIIKIQGKNCSRPVSNYEYETRLNDIKRQILILKRTYLSTLITDLRNSMKYNKDSSDYISDNLKNTYNPRLSGV